MPLYSCKQGFEQLQGFDIEVVGGLVQHQNIGGTGEQARQQQAVAFTARETFHRRTGALRREQEVFQIADDVLLLTADFDEIAALADGVRQGGLFVQLGAELVEIGDRQLGSQLH